MLGLALFTFLFIAPNALLAANLTQTEAQYVKENSAAYNDANWAGLLGGSYSKKGNYDKALFWLKRAYEIGDDEAKASAANNLGVLYRQNEVKNINESIRWYKIAIEIDGSVDSIYNLGIIYKNDLKDYPKAIELYEKAYKLGLSDGAYSLGILYEDFYKDYPKAIEWYEAAHKAGNENAAYALGILYMDIYKDYPNAIKWYEIAYKMGDNDAAHSLGLLYKDALKDYAKALEWFQISFDKHKRYASLYWIGIMYKDGIGVKQDLVKARSLLQKVFDNSVRTLKQEAKEALKQLDKLDQEQSTKADDLKK
jgi:TPR repeat protein